MRLNVIGKSLLAVAIIAMACGEGDFGASESTGQGGSMARFAIQGSHLYVASNAVLGVYNIANNTFTHVRDLSVGFGLETIFAKGNYLYLGSVDAMYIYSIANPAQPEFIFRYTHMRACDPVVVQGNLAYVTLRTGGACIGTLNELEVIDISDKNNPQQIATFQMAQPGGLGISGNCLFVCEGEAGLKMLDVQNPLQIQVVNQITDIHAYDVIVEDGYFTLTGADGVFQYVWDCATHSMTQISKIPVERAEQ